MNVSANAGYDALLERYAERRALEAGRSTTFVQCLKDYGIAPSIPVTTPKGVSITIRAIDIYAVRKRCFPALDLEQTEYPLSARGEQIVDLYEHWLTSEHTERYRALVSPAQRQWLRRVVTLVVVRHIMELKYERYKKEGIQTFADPWACSEMGRLSILHHLPGQLAQLVHHIVKDPGQSQEIIDHFYAVMDVRMKGCLLVEPVSLPLLPLGAKLPLLSLAQERDDE